MIGLLVVGTILDAGKIIKVCLDGFNQTGDFFGLWAFARFGQTHGFAGIYDNALLQSFEVALRPGFAGFYPCPYPPSFLLFTQWLGWFSLGVAWLVWTVAGFMCLAAACVCLFGAGFRLVGTAFVLLAPASLLNGLSGETGFFTTALLVAGLAGVRRAPVLAGVAFGLLTLKPQLGVLVPFALLARGAWRAVMAAGCVGILLVLVSVLLLPAGMWRLWAQALPRYEILVLGNHQLFPVMVTMHAGLSRLGVADGWAVAGQMVVSAMIAWLVMRCFRRADFRMAAAALLAGCVLAAPHAFLYDAPCGAVALVLVVEWLGACGRSLSTIGLGLGLVAYLSPFAMYLGQIPFGFFVPQMLVFGWIVSAGLAHHRYDEGV
jgi:multidrug transporter EmrE-like cation transporter